jgi:hypothetical protein
MSLSIYSSLFLSPLILLTVLYIFVISYFCFLLNFFFSPLILLFFFPRSIDRKIYRHMHLIIGKYASHEKSHDVLVRLFIDGLIVPALSDPKAYALLDGNLTSPLAFARLPASRLTASRLTASRLTASRLPLSRLSPLSSSLLFNLLSSLSSLHSPLALYTSI